MKTILVTGGAGFIGSHFVDLIIKITDYYVIILDKLTYAGKLENMSSFINLDNIEFIKGDICDYDLVSSVFDRFEIDFVVNFAAESHVDNSILTPSKFIETNVNGTHTLLSIAKTYWKKNHKWKDKSRFIQVSTDEVYGMLGSDGYFSEFNCINPSSPYSASKAAADMLCNSYFKTYGLPVIITRSSNNYGPRQDTEKLIPKSITNLINSMPITLYGSGNNIRDWIFVEDNCHAILKILQHGLIGEVYNIGGGKELTNIAISKLILKKMKKTKKEIIFIEDRPGHDFRYAIDDLKVKSLIGEYVETTIEEGLDKTIRFYVEHNSK